jgi:hypothetical protein
MVKEKVKSKIKTLRKSELVDLIIFLIEKNSNCQKLLSKKLGIRSMENHKLIIKRLRREINNHTGSYYNAYILVKDFAESSTDDHKILEITMEALEYFFIEIDLYGHEVPDSLFDYTLEIYEYAIECAYNLKDFVAADSLYIMVRDDIVGIYEPFEEVFHNYFDFDDEENIIII